MLALLFDEQGAHSVLYHLEWGMAAISISRSRGTSAMVAALVSYFTGLILSYLQMRLVKRLPHLFGHQLAAGGPDDMGSVLQCL